MPHPLSARGREAYDFATTDSLTIRVGTRAWDVMQVDVRPRDDRQPRVVGALYLDRATASVVRMSISFTRAALLDPALEDVTVVPVNHICVVLEVNGAPAFQLPVVDQFPVPAPPVQ
mgnify:CR=1 FL=1